MQQGATQWYRGHHIQTMLGKILIDVHVRAQCKQTQADTDVTDIALALAINIIITLYIQNRISSNQSKTKTIQNANNIVKIFD